jgi:hypothetical protein
MRKWTKEDESSFRDLLDKRQEVEQEREQILRDLVDGNGSPAKSLGLYSSDRSDVVGWLADNADAVIEALQRWKEYE